MAPPSHAQEYRITSDAEVSDEANPITYVESATADADDQSALKATDEKGIFADQGIPGRAVKAAPSAETVQLAGMEEPDATESQEASPAGGMSDFREYLESDIRLPEELAEGDSASVLLQFIVRSDGQLRQFKAIKSPGRFYSREAIRLISDGPLWNPAIRDEVPVDDTVRLNILFHP